MVIKRLCLSIVAIILLPGFVFAKTANDPLLGRQWYLGKIEAYDAWDDQTGDKTVVVAVLDTGVDLDHPDLEDNIWINNDEIPDNGRDDDNNGYIDDVYGWDFVKNDNDPEPDINRSANSDAVSHGTLIAGIIGAEGNNSRGVSGINWNVSIMPLRILNSLGAGDSVDVAKAIYYAVANGADVINMSFSGDENDINLQNAVQYAYDNGVVVVSALGNDGENVNKQPVYPACYNYNDEDWVIGVAAVDKNDTRSLFSNYGSDCVDLSAPGEDIYGLSYYDPAKGYDKKYSGQWDGTSMSAPMVAGAAAILLAEYPDLSPDSIRNILKLSVDPISSSTQDVGQMGAGRLNIAKALSIAGNFSEQTEDNDNSSQDSAGSEAEIVVEGVEVGDFVKAPSFSTVYYIGEQGRYAVIDEQTFFTWKDDFSVIKEVSDEDLSAWSLAGVLLPKPGVVLVKIQSDAAVYALEENPDNEFSPLLRQIPNEEIAKALYGENWADYVID
ncbi:hypothetical protein D6827_03700, partial [Candidatus Parcubacteria bacterium]